MKTAPEKTYSSILIGQWNQVNEKINTLAEQFPEDRYEFQPDDRVRTFGGVLRHVAFWNQFVANAARGIPMDESPNELPVGEYSGKARIVEALEKSAAEATAALSEREVDLSSAEMCLAFLAHSSEHYGQLVTYYRLNGIVPPASR